LTDWLCTMAARAYLRGNQLLHEWGVERFPFLKESKQQRNGDEPARFMQAEFSSTEYARWAPRDVMEPCGSYAEFESRGYHEMELPISLVGHGGTPKKPAPSAVVSNRFTRPQYSYIHLPFSKLVDFLERLHPEDRFIAFLLYEGVYKTHIYADLDADVSVFSFMKGREDEHIAEFVFQLATFFHLTFGKQMDLRGLVLLQASNEKKVSWHLHCSTEAFTEVKQLKAFVHAFRKHIEKEHDEAKVKLCVKKDDGSFIHFCDLAPFGSNQNFRAPWNQKPGKNPLLPRTFVWVEPNRLVFTAATEDPREIKVETLFRAHPNLALPTRRGYTFLEMPECKEQQKLVLKRKASTPAPSDDTESSKSPRRVDMKEGESGLTHAEIAAVREILQKDLGKDAVFDTICRSTDRASGHPCIKGTCHVQTAYCPHRSQGRAQKYMHHSNRMRFQIEDGAKCFFCFAPDCRSVYLAWQSTDADRKLIDPAWEPPVPQQQASPTAAAAASASPASLTSWATSCW
jgi:hypothetical protein